jgi:hypothetical protein
VLGGEIDELTTMSEQVGPIYDGLHSAPRMLGSLLDGGHFIFSNACTLIPSNEECSAPYLDDDLGHPELAAVGTAFLRWARGEAAMSAHLPHTAEMWAWTAD